MSGIPISYLTAGEAAPWCSCFIAPRPVPVLNDIAAAGLRPVAVDFPGFGCTGGEHTMKEASVPRLSGWL